LVRRSDFDRYAGHVAQVEMSIPIDGRRRFRGELIGAEGDSVRIRCGDAMPDHAEILLRIDDMMEAKLVLTDALVSKSLRRSKHGDREARRLSNGKHEPRQTKHRNAALEQDQHISQLKGD